ncbi:hypothetical protein GF325_02940 [Candidatus Bathyarchaeota archaeon]|nr:hypothetical protein [Candidatus Bathyarchaeota archaeon]
MKKKLRRRLIHVGVGFAFVGIYLGTLSLEWLARPAGYRLNPDLEYNDYDAVNDGLHNSNTDMTWWNGSIYMVHASSPYHMGSTKCRLVIWRSHDMQEWTKLVELHSEGEDIRDPKFANIGGKLFLYALRNKVDDPIADPYGTIFSWSDDGETWQDWEDIEHDGWLFWRAKSPDNVTWYVPAYWHEHGKSALFTSTDGKNWTMVSQIHQGEGNDETAVEFLPNGSMICTARLEYRADTGIGSIHASTLVAIADPPFTTWYKQRSRVARLDGPRLFSLGGRTFAVGRYQPEMDVFLTRSGGIFSKKRTGIYEVLPGKLVYLTDLPSAGDTSYPGIVKGNGSVYMCYYTSNIQRDFPWVFGMFAPSAIRMVNATAASILSMADDPPSRSTMVPWDGYIVLGTNLAFDTWVIARIRVKNRPRKQATKLKR